MRVKTSLLFPDFPMEKTITSPVYQSRDSTIHQSRILLARRISSSALHDYIPLYPSFLDRWSSALGLSSNSLDGDDVHVDAFIGAWSEEPSESASNEEEMLTDVRGRDFKALEIVDAERSAVEYMNHLHSQIESISKKEVVENNVAQHDYFIEKRNELLDNTIMSADAAVSPVGSILCYKEDLIDRVSILEIKLSMAVENNIDLRLGHRVCMSEFEEKLSSSAEWKVKNNEPELTPVISSLRRDLDDIMEQLISSR